MKTNKRPLRKQTKRVVNPLPRNIPMMPVLDVPITRMGGMEEPPSTSEPIQPKLILKKKLPPKLRTDSEKENSDNIG